MTKRLLIAAAFLLGCASLVPNARAQTIIDEWASVKAPNPPELKPVKVDPKKTALLLLDLVTSGCNEQRRPRCVQSLPKMEKLLGEARSRGLTVIYSLYPGAKPEQIQAQVAPKGDEPIVLANADKFVGTDLEKILKDNGITTVILMGTAAHGADLFTAAAASLRGFKVIVPVEGVTAESAYAEQAALWILANAPTISGNVTLTKVDLISY
jgi:nicotinamidase-related amidase